MSTLYIFAHASCCKNNFLVNVDKKQLKRMERPYIVSTILFPPHDTFNKADSMFQSWFLSYVDGQFTAL